METAGKVEPSCRFGGRDQAGVGTESAPGIGGAGGRGANHGPGRERGERRPGARLPRARAPPHRARVPEAQGLLPGFAFKTRVPPSVQGTAFRVRAGAAPGSSSPLLHMVSKPSGGILPVCQT